MARRRVSKKRFECGHRGFGAHCHRCERADMLEDMLKNNKVLVDHKGNKKPRTWTKNDMKAEAKRLRVEAKVY